MSELKLQPVDLTELQDGGVLAAANELFFWPFGLALTWTINNDLPPEKRIAFNLHVTEWSLPDGEKERIDWDPDDGTRARRHEAFKVWVASRVASMKAEETDRAIALARRWKETVGG